MMIKIKDIIDNLQGTCNTLQSACKEIGIEECDLTEDDLLEIDNEIFLCDECGWWYEIIEVIETGITQICSDCFNDN